MICNIEYKKILKEMKGHSDKINTIAFSRNG